jgi:beta-lactamase class A
MSWSVNGSMSFTAASTYKLAVLMLEAERIASGGADPNGLVCYAPSDYEPGWFDDYVPGACFTRGALAARAGLDSDNTAGLMLLDDVGGIDALNRWAATAGATSSSFAYPNVTTADDLTHLWVAEAAGRLGGAAAQGWLYPMLTGTTTESGIPAGVGPGALVVHKTGSLDPVFNDTALVRDGPDGPYVVTVLTDGLGQDAAWPLIASISKDVWEFESAR